MQDKLIQALAANVKQLFDLEVTPELTRPDAKFGDFACNISLQLAGRLGKNPREVAEQLKGSLESADFVRQVDIAGPGFLNIWLTDDALVDQLTDGERVNLGEVVIETNNPNPFKAMHIGHAFNGILADTVANLLDSAGYQTRRVSYHGDVGAHVGKSMYSLLQLVDGDASKLDAISEDEQNAFMSRMYAQGAAAYKEDEQAKIAIDQLAQQSFTREDPVYEAVYERIIQWSWQQIDKAVARMGNQPIERRYLESQADDLGVQTVKAHVGDVFIESDGALVFPGSKYGIFDNAFVKSNGRGLYAARDLGLMQLKHQDYPEAKHSYIVTAEEQRDYFRGVIKAAEMALPELNGVTINISTGTVKLTTGKMSSRSGDVIEIAWLFDQIKQALEREGATADDTVLAGALRYEFLRVRIGSDVTFDVDAAVSIKGNSGPYLQYAHARACSILAKAEATAGQPVEFDDAERTLLRKVGEYQDVLARAQAELLPHHICIYIYELSQEFNRFYEHNRVIDDPRQATRLWLVQTYADTLKRGLQVLGIHAPTRM